MDPNACFQRWLDGEARATYLPTHVADAKLRLQNVSDALEALGDDITPQDIADLQLHLEESSASINSDNHLEFDVATEVSAMFTRLGMLRCAMLKEISNSN